MAGNRTRVNCLEGSYAHHYTTNATPTRRRTHTTPGTATSQRTETRRCRGRLPGLPTLPQPQSQSRSRHRRRHRHLHPRPPQPGLRRRARVVPHCPMPPALPARTRLCCAALSPPDCSDRARAAHATRATGAREQPGQHRAGTSPPRAAWHSGGSGTEGGTPPALTHARPPRRCVFVCVCVCVCKSRSQVSEPLARRQARDPTAGRHVGPPGSGRPEPGSWTRGPLSWHWGERPSKQKWPTDQGPPVWLKRMVCLPVGESNPGLPRDRRGYSPLY